MITGGVLLSLFLFLPQLSLTDPQMLHDAIPYAKLFNKRFRMRRLQAQTR